MADQLRAAAEQALEALQHLAGFDCDHSRGICVCEYRRAAESLRAALAQAEPVQEPFALPCPTPKACKAHCCSGYCVPPKSPAEPGQAVPCEHCSSPLFAAVQCRVCGRKEAK